MTDEQIATAKANIFDAIVSLSNSAIVPTSEIVDATFAGLTDAMQAACVMGPDKARFVLSTASLGNQYTKNLAEIQSWT
jgi:hypothetical protein